MVSVGEIEKHEFNVNIPRYIDSQEAEDIQDIEAHLNGGIPNHDIDDLQNYWEVYPTLKTSLFGESKRKGYSTLKIAQEEIKHTIFSHPEFTTYAAKMEATFATWKEKTTVFLKNLTIGAKPKEVINGISEDILATFSKTHLIDKYDIYEHLMEYWAETMQDDVYLIAVNGWKAQLEPVEGKKGEVDCDLIPKYLVINRYFACEKQAIEDLKARLDTINQEIEELIEEHNGEDGYFADFEKINKAAVTARIKEIKGKPEDAEELKVMEKYLALQEQESEAKKKVKEAEKALETKVIAKYKKLTESEIKILVVNDKWMASIEHEVNGEMDRISQRLTGRIKELAERYATPLPTLIAENEKLTAKVNEHLKNTGFQQDAMQQLLNGKKRLPGFSEEWETSTFVEIVEKYIDYRGRTPKKLGMDWGGGNILALSANNVQMGKIDTSKEAYFGSTELYKKWMVQGECEKNDVLLTMEAPLGNVAQIPDNKKYILSQRVLLIKPRDWLLRDFLAHYMKGFFFQK